MTSLRVVTEEIEPSAALFSAAPSMTGCIWVRGGEGVVTWGEAARLDIPAGSDPFAAAGAWLDDLNASARVTDDVGAPGSGLVAFASFAFDPDIDPSVVIVPRSATWHVAGRAWRTTCGDGSDPIPEPTIAPRKIRYGGSTVNEVGWLEAVDGAVTRIRAGELDKVVLARDLLVWSDDPFDQRVLCERLAARFPECHTFAVDGLIGASPEPVLTRRGDEVSSLTLAGTARRGIDDDDDAAIGAAMMTSDKDLDEHRHAVDSVRDAFAEVCTTVDVDANPHLLKLANVQHLATNATGTVRAGISSFEVLARLHPTAAVGGTPTRDAIELIRRIEGMERGRYAGPVGWIDPRGDCEFAIALRCAEVDGNRARLFAGNGIVADSVPEAELEETRVKLRAVRSALEAVSEPSAPAASPSGTPAT